MEKNSLHTVRISGYTFEGAGIARVDGMAVFVPYALKNELCEIRIIKAKKSFAYARLVRVIEPSVERVTPICEYFPKCGGCDTWHMSYKEELRFKETRVRDAITRIAGLDVPIDPIVGATSQSRYRNKAQFPAGACGGHAVSGFYREHSHDIVPSKQCLIQSEKADLIRAAVSAWQDEFHIPSYDEQTDSGTVRHIYVRTGESGASVCIVARKPFAHADELCSQIRAACPDVCGISLNINDRQTNVILGARFETLWGSPYMEDRLMGLRFRISPAAFYQVNRDQAERLYEKAVSLIAESGAESALDLYCGIGTITLCMAAKISRVIGVEVVPEAIEDARENCRINGITNADFFCGDSGEVARVLAECGERPDAILVDPPRKGLFPEVIDEIKALSPKTLVYVSCDPGTLSRDLVRLCTDYEVKSITPIDLFPRTRHVETVVLMSRNEK